MNDICDLTEAEIDIVAGGAATTEGTTVDCPWGSCTAQPKEGAIRAAVNRIADIFR